MLASFSDAGSEGDLNQGSSVAPGKRTANEPIEAAHQAGTLSAAYVRVLLSYLRSRGHDPISVLNASVLDRFEGSDAVSRLGVREWHDLLDRAERYCGEADLVPALAQHFQPWHAGLIGFTVMTSQTVAQMGSTLARFYHLLNNVYQIERGREDGRFFLRLVPATAEQSQRLVRLSLGVWVQTLRWLTGRHDLVFDADFTGPTPANAAAYRSLFRGTVRFEQGENTLRGAVDYVDLQLTALDPAVHNVLHSETQARLEMSTQSIGRFVSEAERLLKTRMDRAEPPTLEALAADLDLPPRTLQRRLDEADLTFRKLVERVRLTQAMGYLRSTDTPLAEIAARLGFANAGTFHRAFKRWTGQAPGEVRRDRGLADRSAGREAAGR